MVDPIGTKAVSTNDRRIASVAPVAHVAAPARVSEPQEQGVIAVRHDLAATAPIDDARIATLRRQIADGRYSITPARIADRLIALQTEWQA